MPEKFYITTPIYYVNDKPHIGHAYTSIVADFLARYHRERGSETFFLTGTDEHGQKNVEAAEKTGKTLEELSDENSANFKALKKSLNLSWDDFIRTSDKEKHWPGAEELWKRIELSGDIYEDEYEGLYCVGCEAFLTEKELVDGLCPIHKKVPEVLKEKNLFFKLSKYSDKIASKIESGELNILPETRRNEILSLIKSGLKDVSFSRPKEKLSWGIPVPGHENQTMYVWCDALSNYVTAVGFGRDEKMFKKWWPADAQILGKDILRFHAAIWPGMLLSAGLPLQKNIYVHGFITIEGEKISKSLGNVINPNELALKYGTDALRYYLLREIPSHEDGDFSIERFDERYRADLANGLGNFASRVSALAEEVGDIKNIEVETDVASEIEIARKNIDEAISQFRIHDAVSLIWGLIHFGDGYVDEKKPWESKDTQVIFNLVVLLDNIALLVAPVVPTSAAKITEAIRWSSKDTLSVKKIDALFPRLDEENPGGQAKLE